MTQNRTKRFALALLAALAISAQQVASAYADTPNEDEPGWSCVDDGNRVCGPGNPEHKPAACYDDGGVIVALWPCSPWTPDPDEEVYRVGYTN